jgi:nitrite reductase/ring-hydroxylating ferredoxin subunit
MRRAAQVPCCVCGVHGGALRLHDGAFVHPHCQCVKELQATVRYW